MFKHKKKAISGIIVSLTILAVLIASVPQAKAEPNFILAGGWDFPDAYGQGIYSYVVYSNSTGDWVVYDTWIWDDSFSGPDGLIPWNTSQAIKVRLTCTLNKTLLGIESPVTGQNYLRHSVVVTDQAEEEVFSQQNFTYVMETHDFELYPGIYWYYYSIIFDFLPISGEVYTALFVYEVYY